MREIYICHQYGAPEHVRALYECQKLYDYKIKRYIILDFKRVLFETARKIIKQKQIISGIRLLIDNLLGRIELIFIRNKILIVGLAPYDSLMMKWQSAFKRNYSIYHTSHENWDGRDFPRGVRQNKEAFENCLKECFNAVACVNFAGYEQIAGWFFKGQVVNHAIDVNNYKKRKDYEKKTVKYIFIGSLSERKNIDIILQYWGKNQGLDIQIFFVGQGDLQEKVMAAGESDSRIKYMGKWTKDEIKENLHQFHFLILPSKREPFGIVLLEALASGIPSIVSNVSGPLEIIRHEENGLVFELEKEDSFDIVMKRSYEMAEKEYERLCKQAEIDSYKYSYEVIGSKWCELF